MIHPTIGKGPEAIAYAVEQTKKHPEEMLGPWFMALIGLTFMMGILAIQVIRYFSTFGYESPGLFSVVVACVLLSIAQWILVVDACWNWFVAHYGVWELFSSVPWQAWSSPIINQVSVMVAQLFFAYRCYTLYGRNKLIFGGLLIGMLAAVGLFTTVGIVVSIDPYNFALIRKWNIPALCVNLVTDLAIASMTLWKLGGHGGEAFSPNTSHVVQRLRNLTIEAAVPPAICALFNMAFYVAMGSKNLVFTWFAIMTPQFYFWSLMFTLNSRLRIRQTFNSPNDQENLSTNFEFANNSSSSDRKRRQTDTRRTTVVFATMTGTTYAPNASMGLVNERAGGNGSSDDRRGGDVDSKVYDDSLAGRSRSELQVDLDRWDKEVPLRSFSESVASVRTGAESSPDASPAMPIRSVERRPSDPVNI